MDERTHTPEQVLIDEIAVFHRTSIEAHLDNRPDVLVDDLHDDFVRVSWGEIQHPSRDDLREMFAAYLGSTEFTRYELLSEPLIRISRDGTMAWSAAETRVAGTRRMPDGSEASFDSIWAWINVYERRNGRWIRVGEASNSRPADVTDT